LEKAVKMNRLQEVKKMHQARSGFTLIDLMVTLLIISTLLIFAVDEYARYIEDAKVTRATADLNELAQAVRLFNIREERSFKVATFTPTELGSFIGTYLEKEPPLDPWKRPYMHDFRQGMLYSLGADGKNDALNIGSATSDDVVARYLPSRLFITRAVYLDSNSNNLIDYGDYINLTFSRPAQIKDATVFDFVTSSPEKALGSAIVQAIPEDPFRARIVFTPPVPPSIKMGETTIAPREFIESIVDFSDIPVKLVMVENLVIQKQKK
jgi:general secretion pathway protein G